MIVRQVYPPELAAFLFEPARATMFRSGVLSTGHRLNVADVTQLLTDGHMQMWSVETAPRETIALFLSEIVAYPRMRVLRLFGLAGARLREIAPLMAHVKAWAAEQGCSELEAVASRRGLEVVFPDFKPAGVHLIMPIGKMEIAA